MEDQLSYPSLRLTVAPEALPLFTTVLQSGIEIKTAHGQSLASFLNKFPGFTAEYLADIVQTIFLNGTAVDDLSLPLTGASSGIGPFGRNARPGWGNFSQKQFPFGIANRNEILTFV